MTDLIFIAIVIAFFVIAGLYTLFCEKLWRRTYGEPDCGRHRPAIIHLLARGHAEAREVLRTTISVRNAELQAPRIARARGLSLERVVGLMRQHTEGPDLGFLGEPGVNVLTLNLALDNLSVK